MDSDKVMRISSSCWPGRTSSGGAALLGGEMRRRRSGAQAGAQCVRAALAPHGLSTHGGGSDGIRRRGRCRC